MDTCNLTRQQAQLLENLNCSEYVKQQTAKSFREQRKELEYLEKWYSRKIQQDKKTFELRQAINRVLTMRMMAPREIREALPEFPGYLVDRELREMDRSSKFPVYAVGHGPKRKYARPVQ